MTTKPSPLLGGMKRKNCCKASSPPADAPMPTTNISSLRTSASCGAPRLLLRHKAPPFLSCEVLLFKRLHGHGPPVIVSLRVKAAVPGQGVGLRPRLHASAMSSMPRLAQILAMSRTIICETLLVAMLRTMLRSSFTEWKLRSASMERLE